MTTRPVNLALQGGGSHGAFTWGVLDTLLADGRVSFAAISGTSAGAVNAVALADGYAEGGREGARRRLEAVWSAIGREGSMAPWASAWASLAPFGPLASWMEAVGRMVTPRQANPFGLNPLRDILGRMIDFERLRRSGDIALFIAATRLDTGRLRVFRTGELTLDAVMASACLPTVFAPVTVDGVAYWDGGYGGNPALYPFFYANAVEDVLLVQINPTRRTGEPADAGEIHDRIDEITFNASLVAELRAIAFVRKLIAAGTLQRGAYRDIRMHRIDADEAFRGLSAASKLVATMPFLLDLRDLGRAAAEDWLDSGLADVGLRPGVDLAAYLDAELSAAPANRPGERTRAVLDRGPPRRR